MACTLPRRARGDMVGPTTGDSLRLASRSPMDSPFTGSRIIRWAIAAAPVDDPKASVPSALLTRQPADVLPMAQRHVVF